MRIILVDDEEELVSALCERLQMRGYEAEYTLSGADAVRRVQKNPYDVAVIDVMMPDMNGLETLVHIKKLRPETEVILLTGRSDEEDSRIGLKHGAFDYLIKPVNIVRLIDLMHKAVERNNGK
jgi:DNA-binding response OmpR family regulator